MLPEFLQSSYARYKDDTNSFATWLLEAAKKCGYQPDDPVSTAPPKKKGKEIPRQIKYTTTIKDLRSLAQIVAKSAVNIPTPVLAIAKRAIKARKDVTSWFLGRGNDGSNRKHAHFISVLEEICETLEWKSTPINNSSRNSEPSPSVSKSDDHEVDIETWLNRFAVLTVEEPQDVPQTPPRPTEIVKVEVVEEDAEDEEEAYLSQLFFKAYCLFQDLHNMRNFISQTWSEYRDNKIDLMNAAVVTDSALQLARDMVQEVVAGWPETGADDMLVQKMVFTAACHARGKDMSPSLEIGLPYNKDMSDVADWCYLPTRILLVSFADVLKDGHLPVYKKGHFGIYDPKADRHRMSIGQKFNEDKIILLELLPEFCTVQMFKLPLLAQDEITSGLVEFARTKRPTIWLSFATQMLLDVHHTVRYSVAGPFGDLRMSGLRIKKIIEDYWKLSESHPKPKFWPKEGDIEIKKIHESVERWVLPDPLLQIRREAKSLAAHRHHQPEGQKLLSQHGILCGLISFHLNLRMQTIGQGLVNQWYDVQQLAFLYNLAAQVPNMNLKWPDMDTFIKIHGEDRIFVGSRPKDANESLKRLQLVTGVASAANLAPNSRNQGRMHRPDGKARLLEPTTAVAELFRGRYVANDQKRNVGIFNTDRLLDKLSQEQAPDIVAISSSSIRKAYCNANGRTPTKSARCNCSPS